MPLFDDDELADLQAEEAEACTHKCIVKRLTSTRDTSGGWLAPTPTALSGANDIWCRMSPGGGGSGGIGDQGLEMVDAEVQVEVGLMAFTLITDAEVSAEDLIEVYEATDDGSLVPNATPPTYKISEVRLPRSYRLAVRVGAYVRR